MTIEEKFIIARWAYAIGEEFISDVEYDHLEQEIKDKKVLEEYINRGWSEDPCPYELLTKYNLDEYIVPYIYSYQTESIQSLNSKDIVEEKLFNVKEPTRLSYKLDGFSLRLNYYDGKFILAQTRNRNGGKSMDLAGISKLFPKQINLKGKILIVGELYLKNNRIEDYKRLRGIVSQRSGVSTAIANNDIEYLGYRCYSIYSNETLEESDKYKLLQMLGFPTPRNLMVKDYGSILKGVDILGRQKDNYDAPTDGIVLENSSMQYALRIGAWEEECNSSYVTGYKFNRGMYDNSVLVTIKPLFVNHKTVSEISVTNLQTIIDNNLRIGYPIAFVERSSVNSVLDTSKTEELQEGWIGRYEEYRDNIDKLANKS